MEPHQPEPNEEPPLKPLESVAPDTLPIRVGIAFVAAQAAALRAHYLTGAYGAMPGFSDPIAHRTIYLINDPNIETLGINAAEIRQPGPSYRCYGRSKDVGNEPFPVPSNTDATWVNYRKTCLKNGEWTPYPGSWGYPRLAVRVDGRHGRRETLAEYVLGEDCRNKMHFDCIGLVNWTVSQVLTSSQPSTFWDYSPVQWAKSRVAPVTGEQNSFTDLQPGDIMIRIGTSIEHMGIIGPSGGGEVQLVEAKGSAEGVVFSNSLSGFTHHVRLTNAWVRNHARS